MDGVPLAARFSLATNRLGYCGPSGGEPILRGAIAEGGGRSQAGEMLLQFEALEPYLSAIARKHGLHPLDYPVVEAYWIGNELLDGFTAQDFERILTDLERRGLPGRAAHRLMEHLPEHPIPHHAFHVLYVGVGQVTGKVVTNLDNIEKCRPSWGRVIRFEDDLALVEKPRLAFRDGAFEWGGPEWLALDVDPGLFSGLAAGDWIAMHWGQPVVRLRPDELAALRTSTARAIAVVNDTMPALRLA